MRNCIPQNNMEYHNLPMLYSCIHGIKKEFTTHAFNAKKRCLCMRISKYFKVWRDIWKWNDVESLTIWTTAWLGCNIRGLLYVFDSHYQVDVHLLMLAQFIVSVITPGCTVRGSNSTLIIAVTRKYSMSFKTTPLNIRNLYIYIYIYMN